jgi:hypothetical protein
MSPLVHGAGPRIMRRRSYRTQHVKRAFSLASFQDFKFNDTIARVLAEEKYLIPTPVRAQAAPPPPRISMQPTHAKGSAHA